jgi:subtilase family serine protease
MRHWNLSGIVLRGIAAGALMLGALLASTVAWASSAAGASGAPAVHYGPSGETNVNACSAAVSVGDAHCLARIRTDARARNRRPARRGSQLPAAELGNNGAYDPAFLRSAYETPSATGGVGQTVAIVDAYDDPNAYSDMAYYRSYFGLPACSTTGGCFQKVNESGGTGSYPARNAGWGQEISLDLDMVSAICPNCHIRLVEANTSSIEDLGTAVNTAVKLGANVVTNSYGGSEYSTEASDATAYYAHPGVAITAASGDSGYEVEFPAAAPSVTAVGGTSLYQATNTGTRNATEEAWSEAGSGCSAYELQQAWQLALVKEYSLLGCHMRIVADVSAVANPSTGVWVYDTYSNPGFEIFGGTSVSAQIVGATYALADNPLAGEPTSYPYGDRAALHYVNTGSNGSCETYLCNAADSEHYNGPTGLGTPHGIAAFSAKSSGCDVWTNTAGGSWFTAGDWSKGAPPGPEEEACITAPGTYTVTMDQTSTTGTVSVRSLTIGATSGTQTLAIASTCSENAVLATAKGITDRAQGALTLTNGDECASNVTVSGPVSDAGALYVEAAHGGARSIAGNLTNSGLVSLAASQTLRVTGNYVQKSAGRLRTLIAGTSAYGSMSVTGTASLAGTLVVRQTPPFKGALGQTFAILTGASISGTFATETEDQVNYTGLYYKPTYSTAVTLVATQAEISLSPKSGLPGSTVTVSGSGYLSGDTVTPTFTDNAGVKTVLPSVKTSAGGAFSTEIAVPALAAVGAGTITVTSGQTGVHVSRTFTVT